MRNPLSFDGRNLAKQKYGLFDGILVKRYARVLMYGSPELF
jgi:hypothetical protein